VFSSIRRCAAIALLLALAGCGSAAPAPPAPPVIAGWQEVPVPAPGARVLTMLGDGAGLLALGSVPGPYGRAPGAWTTADGRGWKAVPLEGHSAYAGQAELIRAGVADGRVTVLGQAFGGAHSNPRLTMWSGSAAGLTEHEQPFEMFGGPHAIATNDAAAIPGTALLVGQWDGPTGLYGAAVWTSPDGATWHRLADDPALRSAVGEVTSALGSAAGSAGFLVAGDTLQGAHLSPLAWTSPDGLAWRRVAVPAPVGAAAVGGAIADRAACDAQGCALLGASIGPTGQSLCWPVQAPGGTVGEPQTGPGGRTVSVEAGLLDAAGVFAVLMVDDTAHVVTSARDCSGPHDMALPVRSRDAAVGVLGDGLLLATTDPDHSRLWLRDTR
jgi:hypothetical protein